MHAAIGTDSGPVAFYVNDQVTEWSSVHQAVAARNGHAVRQVEVPGMQARDFFDRYRKDLYYIKVDVEAADGQVLVGLLNSTARPKYLSAEASSAEYLGIMRAMGYDGFKLINQAYYFSWRCPNPPLEGKHVDHDFKIGASGLFGEETEGDWVDADAVAEAYLSMRRVQRQFPHVCRDWWDFHARRS